MTGTGFWEELDTDVCGDFFDHIDDLLDFSNVDIEAGVLGENHGSNALSTVVPDDGVNFSDSTLSSGHGSSLRTEDDLAAGLSVPCEDLDQLEWLSTFVEDSFSAGNIAVEENQNNKDSQFRVSSPVSVLESSSCNGKPMPLSPDTVVPGRARSKRPRPAFFNPRPPLPLFSSTSSSETTTGSAPAPLLLTASEYPPELEDFAESQPPENTTQKKMKKKIVSTLQDAGASERTPTPSHTVRKCMHCEIQKTPQWRAGPMGPKTLCNACGVRYKSGRLYPEYRPAASPTFLASLHSNSHKKVLEMRTKMGQKEPAPTPQFVRKNNPIINGGEISNRLLVDYKM
ncbi:GATA transcription factor 8-like isoform X2 [Aristolochia californica]|uniref:GATA transcription factor 8-like isoform X2 n=1 Tax=Aristolochia californica TaxID=171875 RepID=UPI0035DACEEB